MKKILTVLLLISTVNLISIQTRKDSIKYKNKDRYYFAPLKVVAEYPHEAVGSMDLKLYSPKELHPDFNVANSIKDFSGVNLTVGGKGETNLKIRGFDKTQTKILIDGSEVCPGYFGNVDLQLLPVSEIKQIQVLKGAVSSIYGTNTLGGVVNIITKNPTNKYYLKAGTQIKRNNTSRTYLQSAHTFDGYDYSLYSSYEKTDGFVLSKDFQPTHFENGEVRNNDDKEQYDVQLKLNYTLNDIHKLGFQGGYTFMNKKGIPIDIYSPNFKRFTDWNRYSANLLGSFNIKYNLTLDANIFVNSYDNTLADFRDQSFTEKNWISTINNLIYGANSVFSWNTNNYLTIKSGFKIQNQEYKRHGGPGYENGWTSNIQNLDNVFLQSDLKLKNFTFTFGNGLSYFSLNESSKMSYEPSFGINMKNLLPGEYSLAVSENVHYPTMKQLFSSSRGNENLKPEKAGKFEMFSSNHIYIKNAKILLKNSIYYNKISNLIKSVYFPEIHSSKYVNLEQVDSYGYEMSLMLYYGFQTELNYSYIKYTKNSDTYLLETPENKISLKENISLMKNLDLSYKISWQDERFSRDLMDRIVRLRPYTIQSFYLNYNIFSTKLLIGVENIFDVNYMEEYGFPGEGLNFIISVERVIF